MSAREPGSWGWLDQHCSVQRKSVRILVKGNMVALLVVSLTPIAKQALENGAKSLGKLIEKLWREMRSWWKICSLKALSAVLLRRWKRISCIRYSCCLSGGPVGLWLLCHCLGLQQGFPALAEAKALGLGWTHGPGKVMAVSWLCWGLVPSSQLAGAGGLANIWLCVCAEPGFVPRRGGLWRARSAWKKC